MRPPPAGRRPCIGCGVREVAGRIYCAVCRYRLRVGLPCDLESFITYREARRILGAGRPAAPFNGG